MQGLCRAHMLPATRPTQSVLTAYGGFHASVPSRLRSAPQGARAATLQSSFFSSGVSGLQAYQAAPQLSGQRVLSVLRRRCKQAQASFFGVGAPEALLVGVVALVIFGPKGLAEAVKSLGSVFRTVSPTIKELVSASQDLRSSLEEQIGLDEIRNEFRTSSYPRPSTSASSFRDAPEDSPGPPSTSSNGAAQNGSGSQSAPAASVSTTEQAQQQQQQQQQAHPYSDGKYFGEDFDVDIEAKRREAAQLAWGTATASDEPVAKTDSSARGSSQSETGSGSGALAGLSLEDLEAELARRKAARTGSDAGTASSR